MASISFNAFLSGRSGRTDVWALVILSIYFVLTVIPGAERQNPPLELALLDAGKWEPQTAADLKRDAFRAHLERVQDLLRKAPTNYEGILLNDLQGPPSSCGCGNLQCRWAVDYHVSATAKQMSPDDAAARFVAEVRRALPEKRVVPVWTTECEDQDLPADRRSDKKSTGYCGTVGCAVGLCPKEFTKQWTALTKE